MIRPGRDVVVEKSVWGKSAGSFGKVLISLYRYVGLMIFIGGVRLNGLEIRRR